MKKPIWILLGVTGVFLCIMLGVFIGRKTTGVYIPLNSFTSASTEASSQVYEPVRIDLNTATLQQLQLLPGIGPSLAERIIEYRNTVGSFQNITEITNVKGIGEKTFEKLKDYIKVEEYNENTCG